MRRFNGTNALTDAAIGGNVNAASRFFLTSNNVTTATVDLHHFIMGAATVPEPGATGIFALGLIAFVANRRMRCQ